MTPEEKAEAADMSRRQQLAKLEEFEQCHFWNVELKKEIERKMIEQNALSHDLKQPHAIRDGATGAFNEIEKILAFIGQRRRSLEKKA